MNIISLVADTDVDPIIDSDLVDVIVPVVAHPNNIREEFLETIEDKITYYSSPPHQQAAIDKLNSWQ